MSTKFVGLLPYLYFWEPLEIGAIRFTPVLLHGPDNWPKVEEDKHRLKNLLGLFRDGLGQPILGATYFVIDVEQGKREVLLKDIQQAVTILRFSLLSNPHKGFSFEQTFLYLFELPPLYDLETPEREKSFSYRCLVNLQDDIYPHQGFIFYPAMPDLRTAMVAGGDFYILDLLSSNFYGWTLGGITNYEKERVIISIDWYNQTFQKHPVRDTRGKIVDIATAFEVLLDLPQEAVVGAFRSGVEALLGGSNELHNWATRFYDTRSEVVHRGKARTLLYKHPQAATEHLSFLWSAQKIFGWCIETMMGEKRGSHAEEIVDLFTPNDVRLKRLRKAGSFDKIEENGLLKEVEKLRPAYPVGKQEDIIWLGKVLLQAYKERFLAGKEQPINTLDLILGAKDTDSGLGSKYYKFLEEFAPIYFRYVTLIPGEISGEEIKKPERISTENIERMFLESAIYNFAQFAGFALLLPPMR